MPSKADVLASLINANNEVNAASFSPEATVEIFEVADIPSRDALTVQSGDIAVVSGGGAFIYNGTAWVSLASPVDKASIDALGVDADTVDGEEAAAFADATHTHVASDVTDFTTATQGVVDQTYVESFITKAYVDGLSVDAGTVDGFSIEQITQSNYDALSPPDPNTLYIIV